MEENLKKKVLVIAPTPFFADRGCHVRIYEEIIALQNLGYEILLCTYGLGRDMPGIHIVRTINFFWYKKLEAGPSYTKFLLLPALLFTTFGQMRKFKPDIVHAHLHEGALIARILRFFFRKPAFFFDSQGVLVGEMVQHGFIPEKSWITTFFTWFEKLLSSWFPVITQSRMIAARLLELGVPESRIFIVGDGVDTDIFTPKERDRSLLEKHSIPSEGINIIYMGLLEEYQGVDLMFHAFQKVSQNTDKKINYIIIGYPHIEEYQEKARELGIEKSCHFLGKIDYSKVRDYLTLGDIAIAPKISLNEGDGKLFNYMSMGLPVVAFERPVTKEILGDAGVIVPYQDVASLANEILQFINDPGRRDVFAKKARRRAVDELSWKAVGQKISEVYEKYV